MDDAPNVGLRRRITIDGEHYYLIVTDGPDGWTVDITAPRENAPENARLRGILESLCGAVSEMIAEVRHDARL